MQVIKRSPLDWALFLIVTVIWAGAYALTRIAVEKDSPDIGLPVEYVLAGRLTVGALALLIFMLVMGKRFPPVSNRKAWLGILGMAIMGSVAPFFLITTAQQTVNSSLAALYTSAAPIFVAAGAHMMFKDERLTLPKIMGILIGFAGVVVLVWPDAIASLRSSDMSAAFVAQVMLVGATLFYALSTLVARWTPDISPIPFAAAFITGAAIMTWPMLLFVDHSTVNASSKHWLAVIALGLGPSALAQYLYILLVKRAGATFLSLTGYSIPIVSAIIGWIIFRETQSWNALIAFALILGGVWLAQRAGRAKVKTPPQLP